MIKKVKCFFRFPMTVAIILLISAGVSKAQDFGFEDFFDEAPNLEAEFIEARKHMITGQYDQAAEMLGKLLERDPDNAVFFYELARTYEALGQKERALNAIQNAHRHNQQNEWILQLLANTAASLDRHDIAEEAYGKLLKIHPHRSNYAISRSYHLLLLSERNEALDQLNKIEALIGITPEITSKKISIYRGDENFEQIEQEYRKLLKAFPHNYSFAMELADFFLVTGQEEKASEVLQKVLDIKPDHGRAQILLARLDKGAGDDPLAAIQAIIANPSVEADEKIKELIPHLIKFSEEYDPELKAGLSQAVHTLTTLHPNRAEVHALAGDVAFSSYQFLAASSHYSNALEIRTNVIQVWFNYLEALLRLRDYEKLLTETQRAFEYYPNQALFQYYLSRAYTGTAELDLAHSAFNRANLMSRRQPGLGAYLAMAESAILKEKNETKNAVEILDEALAALGPEADLLLLKTTILLESENHLDEIAQLLNYLEKAAPFDPDYLLYKALFTHHSGDLEKAAEITDKIWDYDYSFSNHVMETAVKIYLPVRPDKAAELSEKLNQ